MQARAQEIQIKLRASRGTAAGSQELEDQHSVWRTELQRCFRTLAFVHGAVRLSLADSWQKQLLSGAELEDTDTITLLKKVQRAAATVGLTCNVSGMSWFPPRLSLSFYAALLLWYD